MANMMGCRRTLENSKFSIPILTLLCDVTPFVHVGVSEGEQTRILKTVTRVEYLA